VKSRSLKLVGMVVLLSLAVVLVGGNVSLQAQQEKEEYIVGVDAAFPPWTYVEKGEYKGFDVDVMREIAEHEEFNIKIVDMPWETIIPALAAGKIDILISGLSITCERDEVIDYSDPYWEVDQTILVEETSDLNAITAMCCGAAVGAQAGTTGYMWVEDNLFKKGVDIELKAYENYYLAVDDLEAGRIDSVLCDTDTARGFVEAGRKVKMVGIVITGEQYAYAVTEGDPYGLLPKINDGIKWLYETGRWAELVQKWFPGTSVKKVPLKRTLICE